MAMGIDQEIQRRMDAYRGNPQALQQRYQMSQQLLDLLALQKLKAEKDAVARQMQAQMQQTPGTVAQQMEQEMLGRTKQEMAQQVGGVMQQQARQQQQGMQRMAQAAARPQGGIGALAPRSAQPAQPGPRMAGGGIVAFVKGGFNQGPLAGAPGVSMPPSALEDEEFKRAREAQARYMRGLEQSYSAPAVEEELARSQAARYLDREGKMEAERRRIEELRKLDEAQMDPEALRRKRLRAFNIGAAGKSPGFVGAGGSAGLANIMEQQEAAARNRLLARQEMERGAETRDIDIGKEALGAGQKAFAEAGAALRQLASSGTSMAQTLGNIASDAAANRIAVDTANNATWVQQANAAYDAAKDTLEAAGDDYDRYVAERNRIDGLIKEVFETTIKTNEIENNLQNLRDGNPINYQGQTITDLGAFLALLRAEATEAVLGAPTGSARDPNGLGAVYGQIMDKIAELETLRTTLGQIGSITPSAGTSAGTSAPPSPAPGT